MRVHTFSHIEPTSYNCFLVIQTTERCIMRNAYNGLKAFLQERYKLTNAEWELIRASFDKVEVAKNTFLLEEGQHCEYLYYLHEGLVRFFRWEDGEEKTQYLTFEDYFFTQQESFFLRRPSNVNIQAIEPSVLLRIHEKDLTRVRQQSPAWSQFAFEIRAEVQVVTETLLRDFQSRTAKERYLTILEQQPEMVRRVPLKYLASFLGITPESLSRIRKEV